MDVTKSEKVLMDIDYFSRKLFGIIIRNKKPENVLKLLDRIYKEIKIKKLIVDNGREFNNFKVKEW